MMDDLKSVIIALQDQQGTIQLLQIELGFQKDRIDQQEKTIEALSAKVGSLIIN